MVGIRVLILVFGCRAALSHKLLMEADELNLMQSRVSVHRAKRAEACTEDSYEPSLLEKSWVTNSKTWTGSQHCDHMDSDTQQAWVDAARHTQSKGDGQASQAVEMLATDSRIFSKICRIGEAPSFIEPLAGILRDPRFDCDPQVSVFSKDWLVFPGAHTTGSKMFFDAGGSTFGEALDFFYQGI